MIYFKFRPYNKETDAPFLFNSWLNSYRNSNFARYISTDVYFKMHHAAIDAALSESSVTIAHHEHNPNDIFGYVVHGSTHERLPIIHFLYVKHRYRGRGLGGNLLSHATKDAFFYFTHDTGALQAMSDLCTYAPHLFYKAKNNGAITNENSSSITIPI